MRIIPLLLTILFCLPSANAIAGEKEPNSDARAAAEKALPLLKNGADGHIAKKTCFACHNQAMPMLAITTA